MRITNAYWEKRNLGVKCLEITLENDDTIATLKNISGEVKETEYVVVKVPVGRFDLNGYLNSEGFIFIESSLNFRLNVKDAVLSPLQKRLNKVIEYTEMQDEDLKQLYEEIDMGLFKSDRILLDDFFTKKQAADRYVNWIMEELVKATQAYKIMYKDDTIGFFTFKSNSDGTYYPFLAGMYEKYSNSGLGFATLRKPIEEVIKRKGKVISTFTSSNNLPVVRAHIQQGFSIFDTQYVFIKHNNKNTE